MINILIITASFGFPLGSTFEATKQEGGYFALNGSFSKFLSDEYAEEV